MVLAPVSTEGKAHAGVGLAVAPIVFVMRGFGNRRCALVSVIVGVDFGVTVEFVMIVLQITALIFGMTFLRLSGKGG